jgi:hypothetical protein
VAKLLQVSFLLFALAVPIAVARRAHPARGVALTSGLFVGAVLLYVVLIGWVAPRFA